MTETLQTSNGFFSCGCGKRGWSSKVAADEVVLNAKIRRGLHESRRREQGSYECPLTRGVWHVTSQPARVVSVALPSYDVSDDVAAAEFVGRQLHFSHEDTWSALFAPERVDQTLRVLGAIHQKVQAQASDRRAVLADAVAQPNVTRAAVKAAEAEYEDWKRRVAHFRAATINRIQQARQAVKDANIARAAARDATDVKQLRGTLRDLALAVHEHRKTSPDPTRVDTRLWAALEALQVSFADDQVSLADMISTGRWTRPNNTTSA